MSNISLQISHIIDTIKNNSKYVKYIQISHIIDTIKKEKINMSNIYTNKSYHRYDQKEKIKLVKYIS